MKTCKMFMVFSFFLISIHGKALPDEPFQELYPVKVEDVVKYINNEGKIVLETEYPYATRFSCGLAIIEGDSGKYGVIDTEGDVVVFPQYGWIRSFTDNMAAFRKEEFAAENTHWGYLNDAGKVISRQWYDRCFDFSDGRGLVVKDGKWGFVSPTGDTIIPIKYDFARPFSGKMAVVRVKGKYGYVDVNGKYVIEPQYDDAASFSERLASVASKNRYGYIDKTGKVVIDYRYEDARSFSEGLAMVVEKGAIKYINADGLQVISVAQYANAFPFQGGVARVVKLDNGISKYDYIDKNGGRINETSYDMAYDMSEGLAVIKVKQKYGYMDINGAIVIPAIYDGATPFVGDAAKVIIQGEEIIINKKGLVIWKGNNK